MKNYYFLACAFPPIRIGEKPEPGYESLKTMLSINLTDEDKLVLQDFLLYNDLQNLRCLWLNRPLYEIGNLSAGEIEDALQTRSHFPDYVFDFLEYYGTAEERLRNFAKLLTQFFANAMASGRFFCNYFTFEKESKLVLCALRAKDKQEDLGRQLQFEDPQDPFVAYILAQKDAENFEAPTEYEDLKRIYAENKFSPIKLYRAYLQYRFDKINDMIEPLPFTMDYILGFLAQYMIVGGWSLQNTTIGQTAVQTLVE